MPCAGCANKQKRSAFLFYGASGISEGFSIEDSVIAIEGNLDRLSSWTKCMRPPFDDHVRMIQ